MISWKYSFEEISKDLELAKKKKQALEDLFNKEKISEFTYESLNKDISSTISEIEKRQKALGEKMTSKLTELEQQINTLEIFLANSEIQHVAGEIDDELHERESNAFSLGLDALRQQLDSIKGIVGDIMPEVVAPTPPSEPEETAEAEAPTTEEITEEKAEIPVETPVDEEALVEVPEEAEAMSEEITVEQPTEAPVEEAPVQEGVETPPEMPAEETEENFPSPEEAVEEPEATHELAVEGDVEEAPTEEETETPTEEASSDEEEEATKEEETKW